MNTREWLDTASDREVVAYMGNAAAMCDVARAQLQHDLAMYNARYEASGTDVSRIEIASMALATCNALVLLTEHEDIYVVAAAGWSTRLNALRDAAPGSPSRYVDVDFKGFVVEIDCRHDHDGCKCICECWHPLYADHRVEIYGVYCEAGGLCDSNRRCESAPEVMVARHPSATPSESSAVAPELVALEFAKILMEWLTPAEFLEMRQLNATNQYQRACASHNYCDSNEAMYEALVKTGAVERREDGITGDGVTDLFNASWDIAKRDYLTANDFQRAGNRRMSDPEQFGGNPPAE